MPFCYCCGLAAVGADKLLLNTIVARPPSRSFESAMTEKSYIKALELPLIYALRIIRSASTLSRYLTWSATSRMLASIPAAGASAVEVRLSAPWIAIACAPYSIPHSLLRAPMVLNGLELKRCEPVRQQMWVRLHPVTSSIRHMA